MTEAEIRDRLSYILCGNSAWRFKRIEVSKTGGVLIVFDPHGMDVDSAKKVVNGTVNIIRVPFDLGVIHGYNHGTAIRDMLYNDFDNEKVKSISLDPWNEGYSLMKIA